MNWISAPNVTIKHNLNNVKCHHFNVFVGQYILFDFSMFSLLGLLLKLRATGGNWRVWRNIFAKYFLGSFLFRKTVRKLPARLKHKNSNSIFSIVTSQFNKCYLRLQMVSCFWLPITLLSGLPIASENLKSMYTKSISKSYSTLPRNKNSLHLSLFSDIFEDAMKESSGKTQCTLGKPKRWSSRKSVRRLFVVFFLTLSFKLLKNVETLKNRQTL